VKIDLHVHSSERSACGRSGEEEMIERAIGFGLAGIFFTDHNKFVPEERLLELNAEFAPFKIFRGIEVSAGLEHILVLGVYSAELEEEGFWTYPALRRFVSDREGFMILAHPYRYEAVGEEVFEEPPEALELRSKNINPGLEPQIASAAERMGCGLVCSSDAHASMDVGMYYIELNEPAEREGEVVSLLASGRYSRGEDAERVKNHLEQIRAEPAGGKKNA
jgi:predicted metal-dependent phosphoesterase TrpH